MIKKIVFYSLVFILVSSALYFFRPSMSGVRTDSGFDNSYSSSDSSSSSSSDYSSSSSSSDGGSSKPFSEWSNTEIVFYEVAISILISIGIFYWLGRKKWLKALIISLLKLLLMILLELFISKNFIWVSIVIAYPVLFYGMYVASKRKESNKTTSLEDYDYEDIPIEELEEIGISNIDDLKKKLYQIFVDVQYAWMEFDYDKLSNLCSNELFNSYKSDLETLKLKNGKNIMSDFNFVSLNITNAYRKNDILTVEVLLHVKFHDYIIDTSNNKVIRGDKNRIYDNHYILEYRKKDERLKKCPSCGADITDNLDKCNHCGNIIVNNNDNYVLVSKGLI